MFLFRKINHIRSVSIEPPLPITPEMFEKARREIEDGCVSGVFFGYGIKIELITPEKNELHAYTLKFSFIPPEKSSQYFTQCTQSFQEKYDIAVSEDFYLVFGLNARSHIVEFASDLEPELYRMLLLLSPTLSQSLENSLAKSDYWLADSIKFIRQHIEGLSVIFNHIFPQHNAALLEDFIQKHPHLHLLLEQMRDMSNEALFSMLRPAANLKKMDLPLERAENDTKF